MKIYPGKKKRTAALTSRPMSGKLMLFLLCTLILTSCSELLGPDPYKKYHYTERTVDPENLLGYDIELYKGTRAWPLALAVYEQETAKIRAIASKDTSLLSFLDPKININVLI